MASAVIQHFLPPLHPPALTGENLCRLCAQGGTSCCKTDPDLTYLSFPLSEPEWRRLLPYATLATLAIPEDRAVFQEERIRTEKAAKLPAEGACAAVFADSSGAELAGTDTIRSSEPNHPDFIASMHALFPGQKQRIAQLFPAGGSHFSLRIRKDGSCVFLDAAGCRLPRSVRPWYCLLFPAWMIKNTLTLFLANDCLISRNAQGPAHGIELLEEKPTHIRVLHAQLLEDWELVTR